MAEMKYTKKAWFVNRFDIVICALVGPVLFAVIVFAMLGNAKIAPQEIGSGLMIGLLVMIAMNASLSGIQNRRLKTQQSQSRSLIMRTGAEIDGRHVAGCAGNSLRHLLSSLKGCHSPAL